MKQHKIRLALLLLAVLLLLLTLPAFATGQTAAGSETDPAGTTEGEGDKLTLSAPLVAIVIVAGAAVISLAVVLPNAIKVKKN